MIATYNLVNQMFAQSPIQAALEDEELWFRLLGPSPGPASTRALRDNGGGYAPKEMKLLLSRCREFTLMILLCHITDQGVLVLVRTCVLYPPEFNVAFCEETNLHMEIQLRPERRLTVRVLIDKFLSTIRDKAVSHRVCLVSVPAAFSS